MNRVMFNLLAVFCFLALFAGVEAITWSTGDWNSQIQDVNHMSGDSNQMAIIQRENGEVWVCNKNMGGITCEPIELSALLTPQNIVGVHVKHHRNTVIYTLIDGDEGVFTGNTELPLQPGSYLPLVPQVTGGGPYQGGGISLYEFMGAYFAAIFYVDGDSSDYWEAPVVDWGTPGAGLPEHDWEPDPPPNPPSPPDPDDHLAVNATMSSLINFVGDTSDIAYYSDGWKRVDTDVQEDTAYCTTYYNGHDYSVAIGDDGLGNTIGQSFVDFTLIDTETIVAADRVASNCAFNTEIFGAGYLALKNPADDTSEVYPFTLSPDGDLSFGSAETFTEVNCNDVLPEIYYSEENDTFVMNLGDDTAGCSAYYGTMTDESVNITWDIGNIPYLAISATDNDCAPCLGGAWSGSCSDPIGFASVQLKNGAGETASVTLQVPCLGDVDLSSIILLGSDAAGKIGISTATPGGVVIPDHTITVPDTGKTPYFVFGSTPTANDIYLTAPNAKVGTGAQQYTYNGITYNATITDEGSYFQMVHVVGSGGGEDNEAVPEFPLYGLVLAAIVILVATFFITRRKK